MSELGALLELLDGAHDRVRTFEAEYRDWSRPAPSLEVGIFRGPEGGRLQAMHWHGQGPFPEANVNTRRIWFEHPDRIRVELLHDGALMRFGVRQGLNWWWWGAIQGAVSSDAGPEGSGPRPLPPLLAPPLLAPARLIAELRFEPMGSGRRADRGVVRARAWPRQDGPVSGSAFSEIEFDAEHGTMLRRAMYEDGQLVGVTETSDVRYDLPLDPKLFVFVPPSG